MNSQKIKEWVFTHKILSIFIVLMVTGMINTIINPTAKNDSIVENTVTKQKQEFKVVFDIPSIASKNKKEISSILGKASKDFDDSTFYDIDGYSLIINYDTKTYKPKDFFVSKTGSVGIEVKDEFAKITNVSVEDKSFILTMVKVIGTDDKYTGLRIQTKESVVAKWDELVKLGKQAGIIYKDEKETGGIPVYYIYIDRNWYLLKVDMKKDLVAKFSNLKKEISGLANVKFLDSNNGEVVAEFSSFSGISIYK